MTSPIGKVSNKPQTHPIRARTDPGLSQAELVTSGSARQRDWAAEGVTWAEGHMGICRSHVSLSRGRLWLLPMLYVRFVQEPFRKVSGKCVRKVSGK